MALLDSRAALDAEDEEHIDMPSPLQRCQHPSVTKCIRQDGATPLHYAAISGDLDVFKALILAGADASLRDTAQRTALDYLPAHIKKDPDLLKSWRAVLRNELPYGV
ncbi:PLA2G6 [Symbiodinium natans]|uniref:PLA2G6 protein n=1 Tax=Symbiodinium natans TaxID=878477 RepID=A0A812J9E6_9DINO|nr:PLA2G6 [Symbiodinium natans]